MIERGSASLPKVLVVDDEPQVLTSLADLLRKEFHVFATDEADTACGLLETCSFALVISDQRMPQLSGTQLLAKANSVCPDTFRILLTAYSDIQATIDSVNQGHVYAYLTKPWDAENLLGTVRKVVRQYTVIEDYRSLVRKLSEVNAAEEAASSIQPVAAALSEPDPLEKDAQVLDATLKNLTRSFDELVRIRQMVPICCRCKRIKTSSAGWEDLASYLERSNLFLSHGYCPECYEEALDESNRAQPKG